jgi:hypothetical protein
MHARMHCTRTLLAASDNERGERGRVSAVVLAVVRTSRTRKRLYRNIDIVD